LVLIVDNLAIVVTFAAAMKKKIITREYVELWPAESQQGISGLTGTEPVTHSQILTKIISGLLPAGFFSSITETFLGNRIQPLGIKNIESSVGSLSLSNLRKTGKC